MEKEPANTRGVNVSDYTAKNLLRIQITVEDIAKTFVNDALALKTTADVTTIDGSYIDAILR